MYYTHIVQRGHSHDAGNESGAMERQIDAILQPRHTHPQAPRDDVRQMEDTRIRHGWVGSGEHERRLAPATPQQEAEN